MLGGLYYSQPWESAAAAFEFLFLICSIKRKLTIRHRQYRFSPLYLNVWTLENDFIFHKIFLPKVLLKAVKI